MDGEIGNVRGINPVIQMKKFNEINNDLVRVSSRRQDYQNNCTNFRACQTR